MTKAEYDKQYRAANRTKVNASNKLWHARNPDYNYKKVAAWRKANPGCRRAEKANRRARLLNAMPKWLSKWHKILIKCFYKGCPPGYHVDHIVPLNGKLISGLHVPWNLQYLPAEENMRKSNKFGVAT